MGGRIWLQFVKAVLSPAFRLQTPESKNKELPARFRACPDFAFMGLHDLVDDGKA